MIDAQKLVGDINHDKPHHLNKVELSYQENHVTCGISAWTHDGAEVYLWDSESGGPLNRDELAKQLSRNIRHLNQLLEYIQQSSDAS